MTSRGEKLDPRLAHFLAFFSRVLLMAFIPAYLIRTSGQSQESLPLWLGILGVGAVLFAISTGLYFAQGQGSKRLIRLDALYLAFLFGLPLVLPFEPVAVALLAETGALVCLAIMNFLFVRRGPPASKKKG